MKPFENFDWKSFWDNSGGYTDDYTGKAPTDRDILDIEKATGYKLPESYIELIKHQNGGIPVNNIVTTDNVCINLGECVKLFRAGGCGIESPILQQPLYKDL